VLLQQGLGHHQANRFAEASAAYAELRRIAPSSFEGFHLGGVVALQMEEHEQSITLLKRALQLRPKSGPTHMCLGLSAIFLGRHSEAENHLRSATQLDPQNFETWCNLGQGLVQAGKLPEAVEAYRRSLQLNPRSAPAWNALGNALQMQGQSQEACDHHTRALELDPRHPKARFNRAQARLSLSQVSAACADFEEQLARFPDDLEATSQRLFVLNYDSTLTREQIFSEHQKAGLKISAGLEQRRAFPNTRVRDRRLRVAFLSPDLRDHSVAYFFEPLLRHLNRAEFEVYLYHDHLRTDEVSRRLQTSADVWRNIFGQSDRAVEARILEDAPDILVEMAGHSGFNRMPLLARRVAPIQISYLGYPNTTGLSAIDFRFTDAIADPIADSDALATERLIRLPGCAWTYQPPHYAPEVTAAPCTRGEPFTFGSFNHLAKLNAATFSLWATVLAAVPDSRLFVKGFLSDENEIRRLAREAGIRDDRLWLAGATQTKAEHLAAYGQVDVALDPFPYGGTTTTCEALWMSVPVVSLYGDRHASRVGGSLLGAIGHKMWIAQREENYVGIAQELASNRSQLAEMRLQLRSEMAASPLLQHADQARRFGEALRQCWLDKLSSSLPTPLLSASALPIDFLTV